MSLFDWLGWTSPSTTSVSAPPGVAMGTCTCCARLDGDTAPKPVAYCSLCDAWLCDRCRGDWWRRTRAALA